MQLKKFQEQIFFATVRITIPNKNGTGASIGTGFLYRVPVSADRACILLISNKHVYGDTSQSIELTFHKKDEKDPDRPKLGEKVTLSDKTFNSVYTEHPNPAVDLACINISKIGNTDLKIFYKILDDNMLADFNHNDLLPGADVWFVGYPENRFDTANNLPVLRRGYIASIPKVDFENRKEFLIDAQVHPGSSGSPVFTSLGSKFQIVGIVTQTMIKNQKIQTVPVSHSLAVSQTIGLGIVLKSSLLKELLVTATEAIRKRIASAEPEPQITKKGEPVN